MWKSRYCISLLSTYLSRFFLLNLLLPLSRRCEQITPPPVFPHTGRSGARGRQLPSVLLILLWYHREPEHGHSLSHLAPCPLRHQELGVAPLPPTTTSTTVHGALSLPPSLLGVQTTPGALLAVHPATPGVGEVGVGEVAAERSIGQRWKKVTK